MRHFLLIPKQIHQRDNLKEIIAIADHQNPLRCSSSPMSLYPPFSPPPCLSFVSVVCAPLWCSSLPLYTTIQLFSSARYLIILSLHKFEAFIRIGQLYSTCHSLLDQPTWNSHLVEQFPFPSHQQPSGEQSLQ